MYRPIISMVVFDDREFTTLYNSITKLDDQHRSCLGVEYVIFDNKCIDKTREQVLSLRTKSFAEFVNFNEKIGKDNFEKYGVGKIIITKSGTDTITTEEIDKLIEGLKK